jgi:hypothetical protein
MSITSLLLNVLGILDLKETLLYNLIIFSVVVSSDQKKKRTSKNKLLYTEKNTVIFSYSLS